MVTVSVLLFHVHEVVQGDQVGFVVDIEDTGLDILDVAAVVVDVFGRRLAIGKDVVIVTVINDKDSSRLDHVTEVLEALDVISLISMEIRKMSKGIPHAHTASNPSSTSSVQDNGHSLLPQKVHQECLIVLGPGRLVT